MSTLFNDLAGALDGRLATLPSLPPVAWPNTGFAPTNGVLWLRPTLLTGELEPIGLSDNSSDFQNVLYVVDIFAPSNKGRGDAYKLADRIGDHFKKGTVVGTGRVKTVYCRPAETETAWFMLPVVIVITNITGARL